MKTKKRVKIFLQTIFCLAIFNIASISFVSAQNLRWQYSTGFQLPQAIAVDKSNQSIMYVAQKSGGLLILDSNGQKRSPKKIAQIPKGQFKQLDAMNIVQKGNYLYIALGDFFGGKSKAGLAIIDIRTPKQPKVSAVWSSTKKLQGAAIVQIEGNYAYLGAMKEGVFIFDISNKKRIKEVSKIQPDINFPKHKPNNIQHPNARGLAIRDNLLYVANDAGGLRIIDVSNKQKPKEIAKYINTKMGNKPSAYNNIVINFPYAYIALDYCGMEIVNIQNPRNIKQVSWWNPWKCETNSNTWFNSKGHTNQIIFDKRVNQVFMSAGDSELQVVNVSNPQKPRLQTSFGRPKNNLGVWGLSVTDEMIYLAYIRTFIPFRGTWSGIKAVSR